MECGIATCPITLNQVLSSCVLFSYSQAWQLGRAITGASISKISVVQAIIKQQHGLLLISGKVLFYYNNHTTCITVKYCRF